MIGERFGSFKAVARLGEGGVVGTGDPARDRVERLLLAEPANATPRMVRELMELKVHPASSYPLVIARERRLVRPARIELPAPRLGVTRGRCPSVSDRGLLGFVVRSGALGGPPRS